MIFFLILVNIIVASLLSCSQANKGAGGRQGQPTSVALAKIADVSRPFWAARGRRSGWTVANIDATMEDTKGPNDEDYGYLEQIEEEPHSNMELWNSRLKQNNDNLPSALIESKGGFEKTDIGENHSPSLPLRPRRYSSVAGSPYGEVAPPPRKFVSPFQEFFSMWLNQIKRNVAADSTTEVPRPFWAARG